LLPIEIKENVNEIYLKKILDLVKYINAKRGIIVSLNQNFKKENIEVFPAYLIEKIFHKGTI